MIALPRPNPLALANAALQGAQALMRKVNPHVLAGGLLATTVIGGLSLVAAFGDPTQAEAVMVREIVRPAQATIVRAPALRGTLSETTEPIDILALRNESANAEPRLPGVPTRLDEAAAHSVAHAAPQTAAPDSPTDSGADSAPISAAAGADALPPAPIAGLTQPGPGGFLPAVADDGRTPARAYARPFTDPGDRPLVSIVVGGLGLSASVTRSAIETLPPGVTLSFVPYVDNLQDWIDQARAAGHEVVIELPMEPFDYPANDPGPYTLLADADASENRRRLDWLMARATGYFGVTNYLGARFTGSQRAVSPVLSVLRERGIALLHDGETARSVLTREAKAAGVDYAVADRILDTQPSAAYVDDQLLQLEALAIQNGSALGVGAAYPVTIKQLALWAETLELKGYALAPASALARAGAYREDAAQDLMDVRPAPTTPTFTSVAAAFGPRKPGEAAGDDHGKADDDKAADDKGDDHGKSSSGGHR